MLLPSTNFFHQQRHRTLKLCPFRATQLQDLTSERSALTMTGASLQSLSMPRRLATAPLRSSLPSTRGRQSRGRKRSPRLLLQRFLVHLCARRSWCKCSKMTSRRGQEGVWMDNRSCKKYLNVRNGIAKIQKGTQPVSTGVSVPATSVCTTGLMCV